MWPALTGFDSPRTPRKSRWLSGKAGGCNPSNAGSNPAWDPLLRFRIRVRNPQPTNFVVPLEPNLAEAIGSDPIQCRFESYQGYQFFLEAAWSNGYDA